MSCALDGSVRAQTENEVSPRKGRDAGAARRAAAGRKKKSECRLAIGGRLDRCGPAADVG